MTSTGKDQAVILLADDEIVLRMTASDILDDEGYRVVEARDGRDALAILEIRSDVRLLFTDLKMPNLDGCTLANIVSRRWPDVAIVLTSGNSPQDLSLPPDTLFLLKPYRGRDLLRMVAAALERTPPRARGGARALPLSQPTKMPGRPLSPGGLAQPTAEPET